MSASEKDIDRAHKMNVEALAMKPKVPPKVVEVNASDQPPNKLIRFNLRHDLTDGFACGLIQELRFDSEQRCGENAGLADEMSALKSFVLMFGKEKRRCGVDAPPVEVCNFALADTNFAMVPLHGKHWTHEVVDRRRHAPWFNGAHCGLHSHLSED